MITLTNPITAAGLFLLALVTAFYFIVEIRALTPKFNKKFKNK